MSRPLRFAKFAVLALAAVHAVYFSLYTCILHERFATYAYDLGTFDQGIWLAGHGSDYFVTVRGLPLLGDHVRLFSFVLAPLYWIWDDVRALLILQSVAIAAGAVFLWRIAAREMPGRPWLTFAIAASYLLNPAVQNLNLDNAHPDAFATTFLIASVEFLRAGRLLPFAIAAALAMSCKEDVPLVFVAMGLAMMLDRRQRRLGFMIAASAGAYFALCMAVILPWNNGVGFFRFGDRGFLAGAGRHGSEPLWILSRLLRPESARYLAALGLPNLYLFVLAPLSVVPALPSMLANLLSDASYPRNLLYHYQTSILPFFYVGTLDALRRLDLWRQRSGETHSAWRAVAERVGRGVSSIAPALLLAATVAANLAWSQVPLSRVGLLAEAWQALEDGQAYSTFEAVIASIPKDAVVSADHTMVPHLSHRRGIYMFPNPFHASNWGIEGENTHNPDLIDYIVVRNRKKDILQQAMIESQVTANRFERIAGDRDFGLYRRVVMIPVSEHAGCGDWNGDGRVGDVDIRWIGDAIMNGRDCPLRVCDMDGDGAARSSDILRLAKRLRDGAAPLDCPR